jgi:hypothetical protein
MPPSSKIERLNFMQRHEVLNQLIEWDGRNLQAVVQTLGAKGIEIGDDQNLWRHWNNIQTRLRNGDVILMEMVKMIITAKIVTAKIRPTRKK